MSTVTIGNGASNAYSHSADTTGNLAFVMAGGIANVATVGAVIMPTGTLAQRPSSPTNGMIRYNSSVPCLEGYANNTWVAFV